MRMITLIWTVALATSFVLGKPLTTEGVKPCCYPDEYEASVTIITGQIQSGTPVAVSMFMKGAYDLKNGKQGFNVHTSYSDGTSASYRLIQQFPEKVQWFVLDDINFCMKQVLDYPRPLTCIPDGANDTYTTKLGGPDGLSIDTYLYDYPDAPGNYQGTSTLTVASGGSCIPVGETFVGNDNTGPSEIPMVTTMSINDYTSGIPDPDKWFSIPTFCRNQENNEHRMQEDMNQFGNILGKRLTFF